MSSRRITIGLLIGGCLIAGGWAIVYYLGLPAVSLLIALLVVAGSSGVFIAHVHRSRSLRPYWERGCTGIRWRRRFPHSSKTDIREFLLIFVDAFLFSERRRSRFSPDDRVIDVYRAVYPPEDGSADNLELETLAMLLERRYGIDLRAVWREDITLGELYEHTRTRAA